MLAVVQQLRWQRVGGELGTRAQSKDRRKATGTGVRRRKSVVSFEAAAAARRAAAAAADAKKGRGGALGHGSTDGGHRTSGHASAGGGGSGSSGEEDNGGTRPGGSLLGELTGHLSPASAAAASPKSPKSAILKADGKRKFKLLQKFKGAGKYLAHRARMAAPPLLVTGPPGSGKSTLLAGWTKAFVGAQLEDEANDGGDAAAKAETGGGGPFRRVVREADGALLGPKQFSNVLLARGGDDRGKDDGFRMLVLYVSYPGHRRCA